MASVTASGSHSFHCHLSRTAKPALALRPTAERLDQTGGRGLFQLAANRGGPAATPAAPGWQCLCIHVTGRGWSGECLVKGNAAQSAKPRLPRTSANALSATIRCHVPPRFPVIPHFGFLLNFTLNFQAFSEKRYNSDRKISTLENSALCLHITAYSCFLQLTRDLRPHSGAKPMSRQWWREGPSSPPTSISWVTMATAD